PAEGVDVRVIAGRLDGVEGPVSAVATEPVYYDFTLAPGASFEVPVPDGHNVFVYLYQGAADVGPAEGGQRVDRGELAVLRPGAQVERAAASDEPARLIRVGGRPLSEPVARYGPFVMNTREEIHKAFEDFQAGRL